MKVLLATHFFPPGYAGGTEVYTYSLARGLRDQGHTVQVVCAHKWGEGEGYSVREEDDVYEGLPVKRLQLNWENAPDPFRYLYENPVMEEYFRAYLQEVQPDVLHITSCYSLSASIIHAAADAGVPVVITLTDFWFLCPRHILLRTDGTLCGGYAEEWQCLKCLLAGSRAYRTASSLLPELPVSFLLKSMSRHPWFTRRRGLRGMAGDIGRRSKFLLETLGMADVIIAPCHFLRDMFVTRGVPTSAIIVSAYGMDTSAAQAGRQKTPSDRLRIGHIGQLEPIKGVDVLIEAFNQVKAGRSVELRLHGDLNKNPAFVARLRFLAGDDPNIRFLGAFEKKDLGRVLSQIDVVAAASTWYENSPLAIYEAFAAGTPVIASDLGGMSEVVTPGVNGLLFAAGDADGLAAALRRLLDEPGLLERLGSGVPGVKTVAEDVQDLCQVYTELVKVKAPWTRVPASPLLS